MTMLTYREAAKRVHRKRRAIQYWRARGMPMTWETRNGQRVRVVEETVLLAWFRERCLNNSALQRRIRAENASHTPTSDESDTPESRV